MIQNSQSYISREGLKNLFEGIVNECGTLQAPDTHPSIFGKPNVDPQKTHYLSWSVTLPAPTPKKSTVRGNIYN